LDQVLICCLIMAANLCGQPYQTNIGCTPFKQDLVDLGALHEAITPVSGNVAKHFKTIEQTLTDGKFTIDRVIKVVIKLIMAPILKKRAEHVTADLDEDEFMI
jgi:hypothetical protein